MRINHIIVTLSFTLLFCYANGQNTIKGQILDTSLYKFHIPLVKVSLFENDTLVSKSETNLKGRFKFIVSSIYNHSSFKLVFGEDPHSKSRNNVYVNKKRKKYYFNREDLRELRSNCGPRKKNYISYDGFHLKKRKFKRMQKRKTEKL